MLMARQAAVDAKTCWCSCKDMPVLPQHMLVFVPRHTREAAWCWCSCQDMLVFVRRHAAVDAKACWVSYVLVPRHAGEAA